jgi:hypothetical protein
MSVCPHSQKKALDAARCFGCPRTSRMPNMRPINVRFTPESGPYGNRGPSMTLRTSLKCSAVVVPLRNRDSSTTRARHSAWHACAAFSFIRLFTSSARDTCSQSASATRTASRMALASSPRALERQPKRLQRARPLVFPLCRRTGPARTEYKEVEGRLQKACHEMLYGETFAFWRGPNC